MLTEEPCNTPTVGVRIWPPGCLPSSSIMLFSTDENGHTVTRDSSILVRWNEVEYLEFLEAR